MLYFSSKNDYREKSTGGKNESGCGKDNGRESVLGTVRKKC